MRCYHEHALWSAVCFLCYFSWTFTPVATTGGALKCTGNQTLYAIRFATAPDGRSQLQAVCRKPPVLCQGSKRPVQTAEWNANCGARSECSDGEYINGFESLDRLWCCRIPRDCPYTLQGSQRKVKLDPGQAVYFNPRLKKDEETEQKNFQYCFVQKIFSENDDSLRSKRAITKHMYVLVNEVLGFVIAGQHIYEYEVSVLDPAMAAAAATAVLAVTACCGQPQDKYKTASYLSPYRLITPDDGAQNCRQHCCDDSSCTSYIHVDGTGCGLHTDTSLVYDSALVGVQAGLCV